MFILRGSIGGHQCWNFAIPYNMQNGKPSGYYGGKYISDVLTNFETDWNIPLSIVKMPIQNPENEELKSFFFDVLGKLFPGFEFKNMDNDINYNVKLNDIPCNDIRSYIVNQKPTIGDKTGDNWNLDFSLTQSRYPFPYFLPRVTMGTMIYWSGAYRDFPYASVYIPLVFIDEKKVDGNKILNDANYYYARICVAYNPFITDTYSITIKGYGPETLERKFSNIEYEIYNPDSSDNPYQPGGTSGPGGGDGTFDDNSDQIIDSSLPTISSANTGFTRIYNPSLSQVQDLARYLWTDSSVIDTIWNHIKQFFENPMEAIIGFNLVPVPVPNGGTQNFALMYIDTGVSMTVAASQFVDVDCGTLELKEYYGSALDYSPNTKVSCFLPFIGTVSLNTDEVMGRTLQVKYRVDICSGSCVAKIAVDGNFIYQYSGHCAINIPISAADFSSYVSSAISVAKLAGGALAAGAAGVVGAGAAEAVQQTNQVVTTTQVTNTARNPATGRQITTGTTTRVETRESPIDQSSTQASFSGLAPQNISNTVGQIMTSKPSIEHSGSFSGNSGYLGIRRPFLIIERPNMCMPANFQALNGFPSMITLELSTCKGFTRVQQVQLTGLSATNPEQAEILQLLKSGVVM